MTHVPDRGAGPAPTALLSGEVRLFCGPPAVLAPHIRAGKVAPLPLRPRTSMTGRHRRSVYDGTPWGEIYDLRDDAHERNNLREDPRCRSLRGDPVERLARAMLAHSDTHPYPMGLARWM